MLQKKVFRDRDRERDACWNLQENSVSSQVTAGCSEKKLDDI
jgi:hypothetical protein